MNTNKKNLLVIANWKMNPTTIGDAKRLFLEVKKTVRTHKTSTVIALPFPFIAELRKLVTGKFISVGAQDAHHERQGTYTGEVSALMLKSLSVTHVIIGHSERRAMGETDDVIAKKLKAVLKAGMIPVLCVGERERDHGGQYLGVVETQLAGALSGISRSQIRSVAIAYEPVWAISKGDGRGATATPHDAHEMKLFIQKFLANRYDRNTATNVPILYGGSVNAKNAEALTTEGMVDGFIVGGASLKPKEFGEILKTAHE